MYEHVRFVLARTQRAGNLGATCRAMRNFGFSDLVLAAPHCSPDDPEAIAFAARARPMLQQLRVVPDIETALRGCVLSLATSGKGGLYRRAAAVSPLEAAQLARDVCAHGPVAVVFGPEDRGLLVDELLRFDRVIEIPTNPEYPALNLAAAATIIAYQFSEALRAGRQSPLAPSAAPLASAEKKARLFAELFQSLELIRFFRRQQRDNHLQFALRHLLGRAQLTDQEADILLGMAHQIAWAVRRQPPPPEATDPPPQESS